MLTPELVERCWMLFSSMNTEGSGGRKRKRKGLRLHAHHENFMGLQLPPPEQGNEWYQQREMADGGCLFWSLAACVTGYTNPAWICKDVSTGKKLRALVYGVIRELSRDAASPRWRALWRERVSNTLRSTTEAKDSSVAGLLAAAQAMKTTGAYAEMMDELTAEIPFLQLKLVNGVVPQFNYQQVRDFVRATNEAATITRNVRKPSILENSKNRFQQNLIGVDTQDTSAKNEIAMIKPFFHRNSSDGDYERVFAKCVSPAGPFEMVDIMISRQSL
ncbi:hypothetical protein T484DRAFT_3630343 [Baffinella frigidus]|nr:hypothetical protein T484DRAFT_3630343 [Cryptophyta sp. CCMP2293]